MKGSKTQQSYEICPRKANFSAEKVNKTRLAEAGGLMASGRYCYLDLYDLDTVVDEEGCHTIPVGTYTINEKFHSEDWNIRLEATLLPLHTTAHLKFK
jgi:hypothetical protein